MSNCVGFQEGDFLQPPSQNSYSVPVELSPNNPIKNQIKKTLITGTGRQSVFEEESSNHGKPEFLRLIIAKSLQNNFINNLWNKSYLRKLHQLTEYQIKTIDDLRFSSSSAESAYDSLDVFTPYSKFIFFWDISQIVLYLFIFFWLPFKLSFGMNEICEFWNDKNKHDLEIIILSILSCDVLVGMNMAFIHKGQIIKNRKRILQNYIRYIILFIILVSLAVLTFHFFLHDNSKQATTLLIIFAVVFYILRLNKIEKILALIQEFFNLNGKLNDLLALVQMITIIIYIIHICACVWHGIANINCHPNWIDSYELRDTDIYVRYNVAVYWATMTMTTVGYGDVTAKNNIETAVNNVTMLIGSIVFAYSVNSIGIFVSNLYKSRQEYNHTVNLINTFMSKNNIQFDLQTRIRSYLQYIWQEEQQMNEEQVGSIVQKLSSHLQDELNFQLKGNILNQCKIITKTFSLKFKQHLLLVMEEQSFSPEERIITLNQQDDNSLYIITKGEVEIVFEGTNQNGDVLQRNSLQWLKAGDYFGEISFITGKLRSASAIARGFVRVFKIKREQLLKLLTLFPNEYEKFCCLKDQLMMKQAVASAISCYSCKSDQHLINECHFHHYCADMESLIKKEQFPVEQKRKSYDRRGYTSKLHPWLNQYVLTNKAKQYAYTNTITDNDSEENDDEENGIYQSSEDDEEQAQLRDNSQSISATQHLNDTEDEDNNRIPKYKRNIAIPHETIKTAGFGQHKQERQQQHDSPQIEGVIAESKKLINTYQVKPPQGDNRTNPKTSKKRITLVKEAAQEERQGSEQFQKTFRQATKKRSKTARGVKDHSQFTDGYLNQEGQLAAYFDKMQIFSYYFPINNYDVILKRYARIQKQFGKKRVFPDSSIYSFFILTIKKGYKLRRLGEELQNRAGPQKLPITSKKPHRKSKPTLLFGKDFIMNNNINVNYFQEGEFQGPNPQLLSNKVVFQQGDIQGDSSKSITVPEQFVIQQSPVRTPRNMERTKTMGGRRSEYQSAYDQEDVESIKDSKPQFLRLIIAKSLQNNFINNLWNRSYLRKLHQLTKYQIEQLDDLQLEQESFSSVGNQNTKSFIQSLAFWKFIDVFTPYSKFIVIWDVFQILTYIMIFFWLPYKISFQIYFISDLFEMENTKIIEMLLLSILALDVVVGLNLAFIYKGQIIKDRKKVIINYFNQYAFVDLV
ncbi:unnamed protein product (macronuclear) [Paramecium tetraurelia]|uniref:Cyclic nucleotide-binding domain-containing protein n=1 Tax=Paramecium tetraurelia TaxID=5888 RepID=A0BDQ5_PARTE|nr:uncharacterized protein GSPATT00027702001 [Paramecium tetraurelia]CAK56672.1 unnamed protein product [Paramecium tetraurelia]|eukprot:XP_001424070.1 hypothetical protein (macronuclear) [Paramecium tetraurelia strain d4-2]